LRTVEIAYPTKIATCCHCGSKAALRLDQKRHELACASCGAPLHDLKLIPVKRVERPAITHQKPARRAAVVIPKASKKRRKPAKRRKSWFGERFKDLAEELFDVVEDIFD
jgi:transcription initiation factor TFIIIB Brf1 subunit/transcription initiation factor TFIIB